VPVAEVTRGTAVESLHHGSVAVVDRRGRLVAAAGDPHANTFTRSTLKPLQALPFATAGGIGRFGYSAEQAALLCASHSGEPRHVAAVADMLARARLGVDDLQCGSHAPGFYEATGEVPPPPPYSPLAHNCSGKHAGMLAWCVACGAPTASYLAYDHPLQAAIRRAVAAFAGVAEDRLVGGIDGCSAPNYALPLSALARAYARLAADGEDADFGAAPRQLADAMIGHPEMVSGDRRSDLVFMQAGAGDWVTKIGAEGVQAIGVRSRGIGIAIKIADGHKRALGPVMVAVLDALGLVDDARRARLADWARTALRNARGVTVGEVRPRLVLDMSTDRRLDPGQQWAVAS
jgi:L-asparaginase II